MNLFCIFFISKSPPPYPTHRVCDTWSACLDLCPPHLKIPHLNPGKQTVYHIRPGCKKYMVGGIQGGDLEIKNIQNKFIFFVLFHVEDIEDTVYRI